MQNQNKKQNQPCVNQQSSIDIHNEQIQGLFQQNPFDFDQRCLLIENYVEIKSRQKLQYLIHASLISKAFSFDLQCLKLVNQEQETSNIYHESMQICKTQNLGCLFSYNQTKQCFKSFTKYTRKSKQIIFMLVNRIKQNPTQSKQRQSRNLRIVFFNLQDQILHICSNLELNKLYKLNKLIDKHFKKLSLMIIFDDVSNQLQSQLLIEQVRKRKIKYFYARQAVWGHQQCKIEAETVSQKEENVSVTLEGNYKFNSVNYKKQILSNFKINSSLQQRIIAKGQELIRIHEFIMNYMRNPEVPLQLFFSNQYCNSIYGFYFNLIVVLRRNNQLPTLEPIIAVKQKINNIIALVFVEAINKYEACEKQQGKQQCNHMCFPDLLDSSKKCFVCKISKPKYGCLKCTRKFKEEIHLCVYPCFKEFHLEPLKFYSKKLSLDTVEKNIFGCKDVGAVHTKKKQLIKTRQKQQNSSKQSTRQVQIDTQLTKTKQIKKKFKRLVKKYEIKHQMIDGMKLYSFLTEEQLQKNLKYQKQSSGQGHARQKNHQQPLVKIQQESPMMPYKVY